MSGSIGMNLSLTTTAIAFSQAVTVSVKFSLPGGWRSIAPVSLPLTYGVDALVAAVDLRDGCAGRSR